MGIIDSNNASDRCGSRLWEIAFYFLRLGFTAFGGPAAHIAMMEEDLVNRRGWLDRKHFLDLIAAINFIPGPNSTELVIALGRLRGGWRGLFVAGFCFIAPAFLIILPISWLYVTYHARPAATGLLRGVSAAVVAIIAVALIRLAESAVKDGYSAAIAGLALVGEFVSHRQGWALGDVSILALAALAGVVREAMSHRAKRVQSFLILPLGLLLPTIAGISGPILMTLLFLKIGGTLFGSGYVLVTYLQTTFVDHRHWLTSQQVLDAIAVGQVTPGPLLTTASFIGFLLGHDRFGGGLWREILYSLAATAAIFAPAFMLIAVLGSGIERLRQNPRARQALDSMNAAVVGLISATCLLLGSTTLAPPHQNLRTWIFIGSLLALLAWKVNTTWVVAIAAVIGWIYLG